MFEIQLRTNFAREGTKDSAEQYEKLFFQTSKVKDFNNYLFEFNGNLLLKLPMTILYIGVLPIFLMERRKKSINLYLNDNQAGMIGDDEW